MASSCNSFSEEEIKEMSEIQAFIASENFDKDFGETSKEFELDSHQKQALELENIGSI